MGYSNIVSIRRNSICIYHICPIVTAFNMNFSKFCNMRFRRYISC